MFAHKVESSGKTILKFLFGEKRAKKRRRNWKQEKEKGGNESKRRGKKEKERKRKQEKKIEYEAVYYQR